LKSFLQIVDESLIRQRSIDERVATNGILKVLWIIIPQRGEKGTGYLLSGSQSHFLGTEIGKATQSLSLFPALTVLPAFPLARLH
jgi:hypothetical protein